MSKLTVEEAVEVLREEGFKTLCTLYIPTRELRTVVAWKCFEKVELVSLKLAGWGGRQGKPSVTRLETPVKGLRLKKMWAPERVLLEGLTVYPSENELNWIMMTASEYDLRVYVKEAKIKVGDKEYVLKAKRASADSPLGKEAVYKGGTPAYQVLDLKTTHDLYELRKLQQLIPNSKIRVCTINKHEVKEGVCRFIE